MKNNKMLGLITLMLFVAVGVKYLLKYQNSRKEDSTSSNIITQKVTKKPLVVFIGVSKYDGEHRDLPGVDEVARRFEKIYKDKLGHTFISTYNRSDESKGLHNISGNLSLEQLNQFLKDVQTHLNKNQNTYGGLLVIVSGHGRNNGFFTSDVKVKKYKDLKATFQVDKIPSLAGKPKIYMLDACRSVFNNKVTRVSIHEDEHGNKEACVIDDKRANKMYGVGANTMILTTYNGGTVEHQPGVPCFVEAFCKKSITLSQKTIIEQFEEASRYAYSEKNQLEIPKLSIRTNKNRCYVRPGNTKGNDQNQIKNPLVVIIGSNNYHALPENSRLQITTSALKHISADRKFRNL